MKILQTLLLIMLLSFASPVRCQGNKTVQDLPPGDYTLLDHTRSQALSFSVDASGNILNARQESLLRPSVFAPQPAVPQVTQQPAPSKLHNFLKGMTGFNSSLGQLQVQQDALNYNNAAAQYNAQHGYTIQPIPIPSNSQAPTGFFFQSGK